MAAKYTAPALVKGLEIIELLAPDPDALTLSEISDALGRSKSEIFRMAMELERLGYIEKSPTNQGYHASEKLFTLGMERPRIKTLLEVAFPEMRNFSNATNQSCHIAIRSGSEIVVVARMESPGPVTFSARIGHRQYLPNTTSGVVIFSWSSRDTQREILKDMKSNNQKFDKAAFLSLSEETLAKGYMKKTSPFITGVVDISAPILRSGQATAALTSPCISEIGQDKDLPVSQLIEATDNISAQLT